MSRNQTRAEKDATYALMRAASSCPADWDERDAYQSETMEPLRQALREAVAEAWAKVGSKLDAIAAESDDVHTVEATS